MRLPIPCHATVLFALLIGAAHAQTEVRTLSPAQSLACLAKPEKPPTFPQQHSLDRGYGAMRVVLSFTKPDAAPQVEVLFNSAREDMQDEAHRYLRHYRLPCLTPQDGVVKAVQEFSFSATDRDATPLPATPEADALPFCVVMPRYDMAGWAPDSFQRRVEHVVAVATFSGNGTQPPEVKIVHSTGSTLAEDAVRKRLAEYRMPCRTGTERPQSFRQQFSQFPDGQRRYAFKRESFGLMQFLRLTREPHKLNASFDFDSMGCPFKVNYELLGGPLPNEARIHGQAGKRTDPNKMPFLSWLASLQLAFKNDEQADHLFGSQLQIDIPCGTLNLSDAG